MRCPRKRVNFKSKSKSKSSPAGNPAQAKQVAERKRCFYATGRVTAMSRLRLGSGPQTPRQATYLRFVMNTLVLWMLVMQLGQEVPAGNPQVILVQDIVSKEACERLGQTMLQRLKVSQTIAFCAPVEKSQPK